MPFTLANAGGRAALVHDDTLFDLAELTGGEIGPDPLDAVAAHARLHDLAAGLGERTPTGRLDDLVLGPPVPTPRHCFGIGLNYADHVAESGLDEPTEPVVFTKFPGCVVGPTDDVVLASDTTDYEAELVVVVGSTAKDVPARRAWDVVAGLTAGQDVSDRTLQFASRPPHFDLGKSHDTYGPTGPVLVSPDSVPDRDDLPITCEVNGEVRQQGSTRDLILDVAALVEYLSAVLTLRPGDLIFTGTPAGVGSSTGTFLVDGDVVTTTIGGIGTLTNRCTT